MFQAFSCANSVEPQYHEPWHYNELCSFACESGDSGPSKIHPHTQITRAVCFTGLPKFETYVCSLSLTFFNPRDQSYSNNDSIEWLK